jgi:hypothetical protein
MFFVVVTIKMNRLYAINPQMPDKKSQQHNIIHYEIVRKITDVSVTQLSR